MWVGKYSVEERTSVDDLLAVEIGQAVQDTVRDFPEYFFPSSTAEFLDFPVDTVETTSFAVFHCY